MKPTEEPISNLIGTPRQFIMPVFQRFYVWKKRMWKTLWKDLIGLTEEDDSKLKHFIGPMVFFDNTSLSSPVPQTMVIDGQQRLITIFILLAAIRDYAKKVNLKSEFEAIDSNFLFFTNFNDGSKIPKIQPRMRDRETFLGIIEGRHGELDPGALVTKAYDYFSGQIEEIWHGSILIAGRVTLF